MQKLTTGQNGAVIALSLALFSCSESSQDDPPSVLNAPEASETAPLSQLSLPELPYNSVSQGVASAPDVSPQEILKSSLDKWNARNESGEWELSMAEREEVYTNLRELLQLGESVGFEFQSAKNFDSVVAGNGDLTGELHPDPKNQKYKIPFSYNLHSHGARLVGIKSEPEQFGKLFLQIDNALRPVVEELEQRGIDYAALQPRTSHEVYLPVMSYLRDRFYPALVVPVVLHVESGKLSGYENAGDLGERVNVLAKDLSHISLHQGEFYVVDTHGSGSFGINISNSWPKNSEEQPDYEVKMSFGLSSQGAFPVNAQVSPQKLGALVREATRILDYDQPKSYEVGFASSERAVMTYPAPKENAIELKIIIFDYDERYKRWQSKEIPVPEGVEEKGEVSFQHGGNDFRYLLGYCRLSVDGKFFSPMWYGSKRSK
ncbi:MAG: hypothetical protein KDD70_07325 [Bdellovibrionales bacterium]|nr:hypothetical protein [Bdellovibrionales bacterium]